MKLNVSKLIKRLVVLSVAVGSIVSISVTLHAQDNTVKSNSGTSGNGNNNTGNGNGSGNLNNVNNHTENHTERINTKNVGPVTTNHNYPNVNCHNNTRVVCSNIGTVNQ